MELGWGGLLGSLAKCREHGSAETEVADGEPASCTDDRLKAGGPFLPSPLRLDHVPFWNAHTSREARHRIRRDVQRPRLPVGDHLRDRPPHRRACCIPCPENPFASTNCGRSGTGPRIALWSGETS